MVSYLVSPGAEGLLAWSCPGKSNRIDTLNAADYNVIIPFWNDWTNRMHVPPTLASNLASLLVLLKLTVAQHFRLALPQLTAIGILATAGALHFKELHRRTAIPKSTLTVMVDGLGKRGLVERIRDEADKRECKIALTKRGQRLAHQVSQREAATLERMLAGLADEQARSYLEVLEQLVRSGEALTFLRDTGDRQ